jgi:hypothetical protein
VVAARQSDRCARVVDGREVEEIVARRECERERRSVVDDDVEEIELIAPEVLIVDPCRDGVPAKSRGDVCARLGKPWRSLHADMQNDDAPSDDDDASSKAMGSTCYAPFDVDGAGPRGVHDGAESALPAWRHSAGRL